MQDTSVFVSGGQNTVLNSGLSTFDTTGVTIDTVGTPSKKGNDLTSPVFSTADDSIRTDFENNILYLYSKDHNDWRKSVLVK